MSHEGNDWLAEKEHEEKDITPHIETDEEYARRVASINMEGIEEDKVSKFIIMEVIYEQNIGKGTRSYLEQAKQDAWPRI